MGQRRASFIRDFPPIFLASAILGRERTIVTLNGSLFMRWNLDSLDARLFRFMLKSAGRITVVGEDQRSHLVTMGIDGQRTVVVVNTCELEPLSATEVKSKHAEEIPPTRPIRLLHLGSLVDTKGFPEYLEALVEICAAPGPAIDAVLCGPLAQIEYSERFTHIAEAERWIGVQMAAINGSTRVRIRWIRSAAGAEKSALFRQADIFVLPTRYSVEAQPLVLLEAMATGCAIITTRIGEIATILDDRSAQFLPECTASALASALDALIRNPRGRAQLAAAAHERFASRYDIEHHLDAWERLLGARESVPNKHR
jgi:glycosyltransferase involved in cell wall biosynthesis